MSSDLGNRPTNLLRLALASSSSTNEAGTNLADVTLSGVAKLTVSSSTEFGDVRFYLDSDAFQATEILDDNVRAFLLDLSCQAEGQFILAVTAEAVDGELLRGSSLVTISNSDGVSCEPMTPPREPSEPPTMPPTAPSLPGTERPLPAATLYVSPNGSPSANGRSIDAPTTLARATELVEPGDVVYLRGGVYPIQVRFKRSGTADQPIVWASYPGEWAALDGSDKPVVENKDRVWVQGIQHNEFRNFEVRYGPQEGIYVEGSHDNVFSGIIIHHNHYSGILNVSSNRNLYEYVVSHDNFDYANPYGRIGDDADGISISSGDGNKLYRVIVFNNSDDGIDTWVSTNTLVDGAISFSNGNGAYGNGNGIKAGGRDEAVNTIVRNSIAFHNRAHGFDDNSGRGVQFIHTTAFDNGGYAYVAGSYTTLRYSIAYGGRGAGLWDAKSVENTWDMGIANPGFISTDPTNVNFLTPDLSSPVAGKLDGDQNDLGAIQVGDKFGAWIAPVANYVDLASSAAITFATAGR